MGRRCPALHTVLLLASALASEGLRLRESVIPPYKLRGETVELRCDYEPGNSSIYSVKWFKDDEEFYRYVPRDTPPYHIFPRGGVTLDEENSQPGRLVLKQVGFNTSGQYRCEVSAEGPDFNTVTGRGSLLVIEPPTSGPVITGGKSRYHVNDTVDLVCTSSPSRPPTHLSWRINGRPAPQNIISRERPYMSKDGLLTQISRLVFVARPYHFQRGVLRVKCVAEIGAERLTHHTTIPETFRAWERSFQASAGTRIVSCPDPVFLLVTFCLFLLPVSTTSTSTMR
ncbi:uncharacterized protein LOC123513014 [Portunus trituberculatus]|uniref:uncharacterized protein LOC123513014 n=1 Tax=Portunus trituberculatus TaxID=210409 RepID=UPI001E1CCA3B|nr:uncharacterized protein LOC123513014 [Portunus trituberculatus]XP_045125755.1 uncharacterized protein LOC123513014 [Portunus trituberculatus]XP_045125756.1 uncharacterized protein LOC123513014 [Portunus trituberculatus]XP_045125757.1 uncharacterized protein LOC123513014 [Portunus trituberculatus]XP_045125758.1 uncharacterized protein LOC123513014 [Portunus trituberculatus]